jgi:hypothetical protein
VRKRGIDLLHDPLYNKVGCPTYMHRQVFHACKHLTHAWPDWCLPVTVHMLTACMAPAR